MNWTVETGGPTGTRLYLSNFSLIARLSVLYAFLFRVPIILDGSVTSVEGEGKEDCAGLTGVSIHATFHIKSRNLADLVSLIAFGSGHFVGSLKGMRFGERGGG
jgi:hypothetical protein